MWRTVRLGLAKGAHFMQHDRNANLGRLPRRLRAGEAAADDVNGTHGGFSQRAAAASTRIARLKKRKAARQGAAFSRRSA